jgi:hypothetical protein
VGFYRAWRLKDILTPLVPDLSYNDLIIVDGRMASVEKGRSAGRAGRSAEGIIRDAGLSILE